MLYDFIDEFDQKLAMDGPAAIFTLNHEGFLALDPFRTRDFRNQNQGPFEKQWCHCMVVDQATGWPQYILITSKALAQKHSRATIYHFSNQEEATLAINNQKEKVYNKKIREY